MSNVISSWWNVGDELRSSGCTAVDTSILLVRQQQGELTGGGCCSHLTDTPDAQSMGTSDVLSAVVPSCSEPCTSHDASL